jgi:beta-glucanase (GH16 family)
MLGSDYATNTWPGCGEIDIMEYKGSEPNVIHGTLHYPAVSEGWKYQFYDYRERRF